ncbi:hypothetical phage protein [Campylobacter phage CPt10]|uniref:Hypothetical phage protein n=1 Tax=Campylobacter phage CPt10 TaxID=2994045 RepID=D5GW13_9CAUD|nr:hypothetical protein APL46_gp152 [Campylobacter phage CPt10]CBJ94380.1 hypothetical phage protein [Campylobacter phage CPt10]
METSLLFLIHFIKENRDIYIVFIIINKVR